MMATPRSGSALINAACSAATSATLFMNSWCSRCALLIRPMVGSAIAASSAVSPGWFMPISMTAARCGARRPSTVSGRPMALLRFPGRGEHLPLPRPGAQDRRGHFLHRGLAVAAHDADDRQREAPPPERGERAERVQRIRDREQIAGQCTGAIGGDDRGDRSTLPRQFDVVVSVEALALECDEQFARSDRPRIRGDTVEPDVLAAQRGRDRTCRGGRVHHRGLLREQVHAPHARHRGTAAARRRSPDTTRDPCPRAARRRPALASAIVDAIATARSSSTA